MLNIMLTRKYALFEQETKRTDFFLTPFMMKNKLKWTKNRDCENTTVYYVVL